MDLIDASNHPAPVTVDPLTGNPIVGNSGQNAANNRIMTDPDVDMDTSEDTSGSTAEPASDSSTYITDTTRTVYPFNAFSQEQNSLVLRLHSEITHDWDVASPASAFPYEYHPDPDVRNWGHALLTSLSHLAHFTKSLKSRQTQAVQHVLDHLHERNHGFSALEGDHVLRVVDVQYAIGKMRPATTDSYRPPCQGPRGGPGGRPRRRGRGRRGQ